MGMRFVNNLIRCDAQQGARWFISEYMFIKSNYKITPCHSQNVCIHFLTIYLFFFSHFVVNCSIARSSTTPVQWCVRMSIDAYERQAPRDILTSWMRVFTFPIFTELVGWLAAARPMSPTPAASVAAEWARKCVSSRISGSAHHHHHHKHAIIYGFVVATTPTMRATLLRMCRDSPRHIATQHAPRGAHLIRRTMHWYAGRGVHPVSTQVMLLLTTPQRCSHRDTCTRAYDRRTVNEQETCKFACGFEKNE